MVKDLAGVDSPLGQMSGDNRNERKRRTEVVDGLTISEAGFR
jgi:hypothetical protein